MLVGPGAEVIDEEMSACRLLGGRKQICAKWREDRNHTARSPSVTPDLIRGPVVRVCAPGDLFVRRFSVGPATTAVTYWLALLPTQHHGPIGPVLRRRIISNGHSQSTVIAQHVLQMVR